MTLTYEKEYCEQLLRRAAFEYGMNILSVEVDEDHVHIYIEIPQQRTVGDAVRILKSVSVRRIFKRFDHFKRKIWSGKLWGASYFVSTVGERVTASIVRRYIDEHADKGLEPAHGDIFPEVEFKSKQRKITRSP